jgi:hypothetical protein
MISNWLIGIEAGQAAKFSRDGKDLIWADYGPHYVKVRKGLHP